MLIVTSSQFFKREIPQIEIAWNTTEPWLRYSVPIVKYLWYFLYVFLIRNFHKSPKVCSSIVTTQLMIIPTKEWFILGLKLNTRKLVVNNIYINFFYLTTGLYSQFFNTDHFRIRYYKVSNYKITTYKVYK